MARCADCGVRLRNSGNGTRRCSPCSARWRELNYLPRERVAAIVTRWVNEWRASRPLSVTNGGSNDNAPEGALGHLSRVSGVNERSLWRILHGPSKADRGAGKWVSLDLADRLLCAMGLAHMFVVPPEKGGLADVYCRHDLIDEVVRAQESAELREAA